MNKHNNTMFFTKETLEDLLFNGENIEIVSIEMSDDLSSLVKFNVLSDHASSEIKMRRTKEVNEEILVPLTTFHTTIVPTGDNNDR